MNPIHETILWLKSERTQKLFPIVEFSGDTDMVTAGWVSLTSVECHEIVVTQATSEEFRAIEKNSEGYLLVEDRVNKALRRTDLKCTWLVEVEERTPNVKGLSFQEFRKIYKPPKLGFRDIFDPARLAYESSRTTCSEFEHNGGKVVIVK